MIIERIKDLIKMKSKSKLEFSKTINVEQTTFNNQVIGKRKLSLETVNAILSCFPDISAEWLMRGCGEMIKDNSIKSYTSASGDRSIATGGIGGNAVLVTSPEKGTQKIIDPDGNVEIQQDSLGTDSSNEIQRLRSELNAKDAELIIAREKITNRDESIKSKDEIISLLKEMLNKQ